MLTNNVTLIGNLGSDITMRLTKAEQTFGTVSLAVSRTYTDHQGDIVKDTQWFKLVGWGQIAERMHTRLGKGDRVLIEGRLSCKVYETKEGVKRDTVEIYVTSFQQLAKGKATKAAKTVLMAGEAPSDALAA